MASHYSRPEFWLGLLVTALTSAVAMGLVPHGTWATASLWLAGVLTAMGIKAASASVNQAKDAPSEIQAAHNDALVAEIAALKSKGEVEKC